MSTVLVFAPHPDDETLGCGGTLLRHRSEGDVVSWCIATKITKEAGYSAQRVQSREQEIAAVASAYDFASVHRLPHLTTRLDQVAVGDLIADIARIVDEVRPETIYLPFCGDVHSDHGVVFNAVVPCSKSFRHPFVRKVRVYETLSETEFALRPDGAIFRPNLWVDISAHLERKIEIMELYAGEMGEHPFPRSAQNIRALAGYRGTTAGCLAAEAFMSLKEVI
ncbi:MAG: GlcNAc-PI de-N-acetylase [Chloroflexi bacterium RBG_16_52_11]|nr:MAG: GlcNAc-PI de-N-acetylase [Chloroflexi bacterium RBG_16_52_11]